MWPQIYTPVAGSLGLSALVAAVPIFTLLLAIAAFRLPAWKSALLGLAVAIVLALFVYGMPMRLMGSAVVYGAAFGLFPIAWIVYSAILSVSRNHRNGKVRDHQGLDWRPHRRQAFAGAADCVCVRSLPRRRVGFRNAGRGRGGDAGRLGVQPVLCGRDLPPGEHRAGRLRRDRHSRDHSGGHHRLAARRPQRRCGPHLRSRVAVRTRVLDPGDGWLEGLTRCASGCPGLRWLLRGHAIRRVQLSSGRTSPIFCPPWPRWARSWCCCTSGSRAIPTKATDPASFPRNTPPGK
jgi:hypothetical protein